MEVLLNSDIAKLVLGYLGEQNLKDAYNQFCESSEYLQNECKLLRRGYKPVILGNLTDIITEYYEIKAIVNQHYERFCNSSAGFNDNYKLKRNLQSKLESILFNKNDIQADRRGRKRKYSSSCEEISPNDIVNNSTSTVKKHKNQIMLLRNSPNTSFHLLNVHNSTENEYMDPEDSDNDQEEYIEKYSKSDADNNSHYTHKLPGLKTTLGNNSNPVTNKQEFVEENEVQISKHDSIISTQIADHIPKIIENKPILGQQISSDVSTPIVTVSPMNNCLRQCITVNESTPILYRASIDCKEQIKIISNEPYVGDLPSCILDNISKENSLENSTIKNLSSKIFYSNISTPDNINKKTEVIPLTPMYDLQGHRILQKSNKDINQFENQKIKETEKTIVLTEGLNIVTPCHILLTKIDTNNISNNDNLQQSQINSSTDDKPINTNTDENDTTNLTPSNSNIILNKKSNSTPRRDSSHIRVLDFTTPNKNQNENVGKWINTKTPHTIERSTDLHLSKVLTNSSTVQTPIQESNNLSSDESSIEENKLNTARLEGDWNKVQGFDTIITEDNNEYDNSLITTPKVKNKLNKCSRILTTNDQNDEETKLNELISPSTPLLNEWNQLRSIKSKDWDQYIRTIVQEKNEIELKEKKLMTKLNNIKATKRKAKEKNPTKKLTKLIASNKEKLSDTSTLSKSTDEDDEYVSDNDYRKSLKSDQKFRILPSKKNEVVLTKSHRKWISPNKLNKPENSNTCSLSMASLTLPKKTPELCENSLSLANLKEVTINNENQIISSSEISDQNISQKNRTIDSTTEFGDILPSLFETPYKYDSNGFPITPRFIQSLINETPTTQAVNSLKEFVSLVKNSDIMTPGFPITPGNIQTPKVLDTFICGSYINRRTDYSSSSSYYRPDESGEYNNKYDVGKSPADKIKLCMSDLFGPDTPLNFTPEKLNHQMNEEVQVQTLHDFSFKMDNEEDEKLLHVMQISNQDQGLSQSQNPNQLQIQDSEDFEKAEKKNTLGKGKNEEYDNLKDKEKEMMREKEKEMAELKEVENERKEQRDKENLKNKEKKMMREKEKETAEEKEVENERKKKREKKKEKNIENKEMTNLSTISSKLDTIEITTPSDNEYDDILSNKLQGDLEEKRLRIMQKLKKTEKTEIINLPKEKMFLEAYKLRAVKKSVIGTGVVVPQGSAIVTSGLGSLAKRKLSTPRKLNSIPTPSFDSDNETFPKLLISDDEERKKLKDLNKDTISVNSSSPMNLFVESDDSQSRSCDLNKTQNLRLKDDTEEYQNKETPSKTLKRVSWHEKEMEIALNELKNKETTSIEKTIGIEKVNTNDVDDDLSSEDDEDSMDQCSIETYGEDNEEHNIKINAINQEFRNKENSTAEPIDFKSVVMNVFLGGRKVKLTISDPITLFEAKSKGINSISKSIILNDSKVKKCSDLRQIIDENRKTKMLKKYKTTSTVSSNSSSTSSIMRSKNQKKVHDTRNKRSLQHTSRIIKPSTLKHNLIIEAETPAKIPEQTIRAKTITRRQSVGKIGKSKPVGGVPINAILTHIHGNEENTK